MTWFIPLLSTLISIILFFSLAKQYKERKKIYQLLYAISLFMFSVAAFGEFYAEAFGFTTIIYKIYYFSAITLVAVMAAGTMYLLILEIKWIPHLFFAYVFVLAMWLLILIIPAQLVLDILGKSITIGGEGMPDYIRSFSFPLSGVGGIVLIIGAIYSWWRTRYTSNLYIAGGAIVMAFGGRLATMGLNSLLPLSEMIGILLLFYGIKIHPSSKSQS